ncbi:hypothetical protein COT40_01450 [Candidatus Peregrinibacteria bacterium CG08_land_8_20_14_0_20_41_10]|nr:MAG: hypothetical protein COT40_01450 [Candidatus Peregrinibacteria bacterium CG08_land_8_20_14_0_20_41_10]
MRFLAFTTYLQMVKNSVGSSLFRSSYFEIDGKKVDLLQNGELSCAFFVSNLLKLFGQIESIHIAVKNTVADLERSYWKKIPLEQIHPGDILVWEMVDFTGNGKKHGHIGFYIGNQLAVSTDFISRNIIRHSWNYGGTRKIEGTYTKEGFIEN